MAEITKSEGSVYFRKDRKRWIAQYFEYDVMQAKNIKKNRSFKLKEEADKFLQQLMYRRENPIYIKNNGIPLYQLMLANLDSKMDANLISGTQYSRILRSLKIIEKAPFCHNNIENIKAEEIQVFLNQMANTYSNSSIKKLHEQFGQAFKYAFNKGYIDKNPMIEIIRPKSKKKDKIIRALTLEEESKFVKFLLKQHVEDYPYKNIYLMQMFMGFRIGEVLALNIGDIDLKHHLINVNKTLTKDADGYVMMSDSPKTKAGNRILPIPNVLMPYVMEQIEVSKRSINNEDHLLFKPPFNKYTEVENVNRNLDKILKFLDISHMSTHSLRHTYATRSIEAGMSPVVLQKLMGHTDVSVTLNAYTSVFDKYKKTELEKVNDYYMEQNLIDTSDSNIMQLGDGICNNVELAKSSNENTKNYLNKSEDEREK